jgi:hypothetical protein
MMGFMIGVAIALVVLVILIFIIVQGSNMGELRKKLFALEGRLDLLEGKKAGRAPDVMPQTRTERKPKEQKVELKQSLQLAASKKPPVPQVVKPISQTEKYPQPAKPTTVPKPVKTIPRPKLVRTEPSQMSVLWNVLAERFMQNWTGIIGAMLTVLGVGFLGVYTALKCAPFYRFLIIDAFALILVVAFFVLNKKPLWHQLALWLRSIAGAIFLFGCIGSGGIEGLQWIYAPLPGLLLLLLGIAVNLLLSYIGGKQIFASLHVLLSLLALTLAPQTTVVFVIASVVTLVGIALAYREKWEYHLLVTIALFFAFHLYWYTNYNSSDATLINHYAALAGVVGVGVAALLRHYQKAYQATKLQSLPLVVHLVTWLFLAIGIVLHSEVLPWHSALLGAAAVAAYLLSRRARVLNIRWLYMTDALVAQTIALLALATLSKLQVNGYMIAGFMFVEVLLFALVAKVEKEKALYTIGITLANIMAPFLIGYGLLKVEKSNLAAQTMLGCAVVGLGFFTYMQVKFKANLDSVIKVMFGSGKETKEYNYSLLECVLPIMLFVITHNMLEQMWVSYGVAGLALIFLLLRQRFQSNGMGLGLLLFLMAWHVDVWLYVGQSETLTLWQKGLTAAPLFVISLATIWMSKIEYLKQSFPGIGKSYFFAHLIMMTIFMLHPLYPASVVCGAIVIEALLYIVFLQPHKEAPLYRVGLGLANVLVLAMIVVGLLKIDFEKTRELYTLASALSVCALAIVGLYFYVRKRFSGSLPESKVWTCLLFLVGPLLGVAFLSLQHNVWGGYALLAMVLPILFIRWKGQVPGLGGGLDFLLVGVHALAWIQLSDHGDFDISQKIIYGLPFLAMSFMHVQWSFRETIQKHKKWLGIYCFFGHLMMATYFITKGISPFITGVVWLGLSVVVLEIANAIRKKHGTKIVIRGESDRYLLHVGYVLIAAFVVRHVVVHLQSEHVLAFGMSIRMCIELLALSVFGYWWLQKSPQQKPIYKSWLDLHPLFLELMLAFLTLTIMVEVTTPWRPVAWIVLALMLLLLRWKTQQTYARLGFYALAFNWLAALNVAFVASAYVTPSTKWMDQAWFAGLLAILLQFVYVAVIHNRNTLQGASFPKAIGFLGSWSERIHRKQNYWIYYPLFLCVALFLYWSFDKAALTLLWVVECFAIFVLSMVLRENHFRYLSMLGLVGCLIRLVVYDLAKAQTLIRAVVFLGVGIIMLVMNTLYTKYKGRFQKGADHE